VTTADEGLNRGAGCFFFKGRKQRWLEPVRTLKGGETRGRAGQGVVGVFNPYELLGPGRRVLRGQAHLLILVLGLAVGLGVVPRGQADGGSQERAEHSPKHRGPPSETTSTGMPWRQMMWRSRSLARGTKWAILLNRSTTIRMIQLPLDGGRPVTKSNEMCD